MRAPSAKLTQLAGQLQEPGPHGRNDRRINAKSIMGVMMLAAAKGSTISLETDGDEDEAMEAIGADHGRFGEGE